MQIRKAPTLLSLSSVFGACTKTGASVQLAGIPDFLNLQKAADVIPAGSFTLAFFEKFNPTTTTVRGSLRGPSRHLKSRNSLLQIELQRVLNRFPH